MRAFPRALRAEGILPVHLRRAELLNQQNRHICLFRLGLGRSFQQCGNIILNFPGFASIPVHFLVLEKMFRMHLLSLAQIAALKQFLEKEKTRVFWQLNHRDAFRG